jgi:DNA repair photolyase
MAKAWNSQLQQKEDGSFVEMQMPEIVSASRSTDIPAFYCDWFFHRLKVGYSAWTNPFNGVKSYVSYAKTRFIVFWSKNPRPLIEHIPYLKERNIKCYVQYTLNDYEKEKLEKVPSLDYRINTFKILSSELGKESVIWRFDPLIITDDISIDDLLMKVQNIGDQLKDYTEKLVFSYADIATYKKVKRNLEINNIPYHEWTERDMEEFADRLSAMNRERGWNLQIATCGEKIDIEKYGIHHNRCIDGDLITRIAWQDKELMKAMGVHIQNMPQLGLFDESIQIPPNAIELPNHKYFISVHKKDSGQRLFCGCMAAKDIGEYNTCPHMCEYCYANATKQLAMQNWMNHKDNPFSENITGR